MASETFNDQSEMIAQAYQVIGELLERAGLFEHPEGQRCLDYFAAGRFAADFLPVDFGKE